MKKLAILSTLSFIISFNVKAQSTNYRLASESSSCVTSCTPEEAPKKVIRKKTSSVKPRTSSTTTARLRQQEQELKKIKKQQLALEEELKKLREANLILTAKQEELPDTSRVSLASPGLSVPVLTTVSKNVEIAPVLEDKPSKFSFLIYDEIGSPIKKPDKGRSLTNIFVTELDYKYDEELKVRLANSISWNWMAPSGTGGNYKFGDTDVWFIMPLIKNSEGFSVEMSFINSFPTSSSSREETIIYTPKLRFDIPTNFDDGKGMFRIRPEYAYVFRRYQTSDIVGIDDTDKAILIDNSYYEKLNPYTIDSFYLRFDLNYKLTPKFSLKNEFRWTWSRTYADSFTVSGKEHVTTPEGITNKLKLKNYIGYNVSSNVIIESGLQNSMLIADFRPFKDLSFFAALILIF